MTGIDKSTRRAVAVIVLLIVAASALRGYLPGIEYAPAAQERGSSPAALVAVIVLLTGAIGVIALAVVTRLRERRMGAGASGYSPSGSGFTLNRPTWRFLLITVGLVVAWVLILSLLSRIGALIAIDDLAAIPESGPDSATTAPDDRSTPAPVPEPGEDAGNVFGYLFAATVTFLLVIAGGTIIASHRRGRDAQPHATELHAIDGAAPAPEAESLARAAEVGLAEIGDRRREPREAIIACYAAMERELTNIPGAAPQEFDTPTEVLARAVEHRALHADSATRLVELFEEARFSPHVMNERHRDLAVQVLRQVLAEMRSPV